MIALMFKITPAGGQPRDLVVRLHEPFRNPPEVAWPWGIVVDCDGRSTITYGVDPLDAIENGAKHAAIVVRVVHEDDVIEPAIEPRVWAKPPALLEAPGDKGG